MDVFFEANTPYFIPVEFTGINTGSTSQAFTVRIRQLTFVGHSNDDPGELTASPAIWSIENDVINQNYNVVHKEDMTVVRANTETSSITGYRDFNAEIFIYVGHGTPGFVCYDGSDEDSYLEAESLPDMSNCELAIWGCCWSNTSEGEDNWISFDTGDSLADISLERGAQVVIAWDIQVYNLYLMNYLNVLFEQLAQGQTVAMASSIALQRLQDRIGEYDFEADRVNAFIEATKLYGNGNQILF